MRKRAAVIIIDSEKRVLLVFRRKEGKEYFVVPGGGVHEAETFAQAAIREIKEETSLDIHVQDQYFDIQDNDTHTRYFFAKSFSGKPILSGEESDRHSAHNYYRLVWVPVDELHTHSIYPEQLFDIISKRK